MSKGYGSWYVGEVCVVCGVQACMCMYVCVKRCAYKCTMCCMKVDREIFTREIICVKKKFVV